MHAENLDLNLLAVLDALFREGSVTGAAEVLGLSQSATSHALNRLRVFFGDALFVRAGSRMVPTRKAEGLRHPVDNIMTTVRQQLLAGAGFDPALARRRFTLCVTDMGELVFLPPLLKLLKKDAPHCTVRTLQVPMERIESALASGDADLALGSMRSAPDGLYQQRLFLHPLVTIVSVRHPTIRRTLSRRQFEAAPHIVVSLMGRSDEAYDKVIEDQGIRRQIAVMTPHFLMVPLLMDQHPELIATVPMELTRTFAALGVVRGFAPPVAVPKLELRQHWHPRFHHDPAIVWLRSTMRRLFENYEAEHPGMA